MSSSSKICSNLPSAHHTSKVNGLLFFKKARVASQLLTQIVFSVNSQTLLMLIIACFCSATFYAKLRPSVKFVTIFLNIRNFFVIQSWISHGLVRHRKFDQNRRERKIMCSNLKELTFFAWYNLDVHFLSSIANRNLAQKAFGITHTRHNTRKDGQNILP